MKPAGFQVAPRSIETSTSLTPAGPAHAKPCTRSVPAGTRAPSSGLVISDFTRSVSTGGDCVGSAPAST